MDAPAEAPSVPLAQNPDTSMASPSKSDKELPVLTPMKGREERSDDSAIFKSTEGLDLGRLKPALSVVYNIKDSPTLYASLPLLHSFVYSSFLDFVSDAIRLGLIPVDQYRAAVRYEDVSETLQDAILHDEWLSYMNLAVLRKKKKVPKIDKSAAQLNSALDSWSREYTDQGILAAFHEHIKKNFSTVKTKTSELALYARLIAIIQSSGTGKSRLLDEIAKSLFQITINLRSPETGGFPPPDVGVRSYFLDDYNDTPVTAYLRSLAFMHATFMHTLEVIKSFWPASLSPSELSSSFRSYLSQGQSARSVGRARSQFYENVVSQARRILAGFTDVDSMEDSKVKELEQTVRQALLHLLHRLAPELQTDNKILTQQNPMLYIVFDEAHALAKPLYDETTSRFAALRRALMIIADCPVLAVVMSTTGAISSFSPAKRYSPSTRVRESRLTFLPPWCTLGFDHFVTQKSIEQLVTLDEAVRFQFASGFGRPLWRTYYEHGDPTLRRQLVDFARSKLLQEEDPARLKQEHYFALLSQRMPIDLSSSSSSSIHTSREYDQVENHLRLCIAVLPHSESLLTISASEPILSEAASSYMRNSYVFDMAQGLQDILTGFSISQDDRGELVSAAIFTEARDSVIKKRGDVPPETLPVLNIADFMSALLGPNVLNVPPSQSPLPNPPKLEDAFSQSTTHFNHFLKPFEQVMGKNRISLLSFLIRGAALQGANNQNGWDKLIPFLFRDSVLGEYNVGFILVQDQIDESVTFPHAERIFALMDPFELGLFKDGSSTIPIIRLVFSMARDETPRMQQYFRPHTTPPRFTSYDFFCEGLSSDVFPLIKDAEPWKAALRLTPLRNILENYNVTGAKRMYPLGGETHSIMVTKSAQPPVRST